MTIGKTLSGGMTRRRMILGSGAGLLAAPAILSPSMARASGPLVIVSWGGLYQELLQQLVVSPFSEETGIEVTIVNGPDNAKAKAQVATGNLEWDLIDAGGPQILAGEKEGLWEPLDASIIDTSGLSTPATAASMPVLMYAGVMAYMPERSPNPPKTFADFFDLENFPGRRGLRNKPNQTMEMALLADGVSNADLYPLDVERAFKVLEGIKPAVPQWIAQTPQTISLLQNGEIDYSYTFNGRVATARAAGMNIDFSRDQTMAMTEYLAVLKGSPRREQAMRFIEYACRPEVQATFANSYNSIPSRISGLGMVRDDVRVNLPDPQSPTTTILNDQWWIDNFDVLERRFKEWLYL